MSPNDPTTDALLSHAEAIADVAEDLVELIPGNADLLPPADRCQTLHSLALLLSGLSDIRGQLRICAEVRRELQDERDGRDADI